MKGLLEFTAGNTAACVSVHVSENPKIFSSQITWFYLTWYTTQVLAAHDGAAWRMSTNRVIPAQSGNVKSAFLFQRSGSGSLSKFDRLFFLPRGQTLSRISQKSIHIFFKFCWRI